MSFKQESVNAIEKRNIAWVFCDETFRTNILLKNTVLLGNKPANCISVYYSPRAQTYYLKSFFWLPRFKHRIYSGTVRLTAEELNARLKYINREIEQSA